MKKDEWKNIVSLLEDSIDATELQCSVQAIIDSIVAKKTREAFNAGIEYCMDMFRRTPCTDNCVVSGIDRNEDCEGNEMPDCSPYEEPLWEQKQRQGARW